MAGKGTAPQAGKELEDAVVAIVESLTLQYRRQVKVGRRIWGAERRIDLVVWKNPERRLGIECKAQSSSGTAEEKIPSVIEDIKAWPIDGRDPRCRGF